jgi:hypothetical protein
MTFVETAIIALAFFATGWIVSRAGGHLTKR